MANEIFSKTARRDGQQSRLRFACIITYASSRFSMFDFSLYLIFSTKLESDKRSDGTRANKK